MAFLAAALPMLGAAAGATGTMATALSVAGMGLGLLGAVSDYQAAGAQAKAVRQQGEYTAKVNEQAAGQERAAAQRQMIERRKEGRLVSSRAQALSAAGGGGASDPTVVDILADIDTQSSYNALSALYSGEEQARGLEQGADLSRYESNMQAKGIKRQAKGNLMKSLASTAMSGMDMFSKYSPTAKGGGQMAAVGGTSTFYPQSKTWVDWYK